MMHSASRWNARYRSLMVAAALASSAALAGIAADRITDSAAAIQAAQRYVAGRCTAQTPCRFRAEREGPQWRVWVRLSKRDARGVETLTARQHAFPAPRLGAGGNDVFAGGGGAENVDKAFAAAR